MKTSSFVWLLTGAWRKAIKVQSTMPGATLMDKQLGQNVRAHRASEEPWVLPQSQR